MDKVGKPILLAQAISWKPTVQSLASKLSSVDKQNRYDQALSNLSLAVPTRPGFVKMYEPAFWCKFNPMDF